VWYNTTTISRRTHLTITLKKPACLLCSCTCASRFVRLRARSVGVREFVKATFSDYGCFPASSDAATAAARRQVMLSDVVGETTFHFPQVINWCLLLGKLERTIRKYVWKLTLRMKILKRKPMSRKCNTDSSVFRYSVIYFGGNDFCKKEYFESGMKEWWRSKQSM